MSRTCSRPLGQKALSKEDVDELNVINGLMSDWKDTKAYAKLESCPKYFSDLQCQQHVFDLAGKINIGDYKTLKPIIRKATADEWKNSERKDSDPFVQPLSRKGEPSGLDKQHYESPATLFEALLSSQLIDMIITRTNDNAQTKGGWLNGENMTKSEFLAFLGMNMWMAELRFPKIRDYWSQNPLFHVHGFSKPISRDRYTNIWSNLHLEEANKAENGEDRLHPIRPLIKMLNARFTDVWRPGNELSVDEDVCPFKGRSRFKQYLPKKHHRWGFRIFKLCDNSKFLCRFDIYQGKEPLREDLTQATIGEKIVYRLIEGLVETTTNPVRLFTRNFFTSVRMVNELIQKQIYVTGSIRQNRIDVPKSLLKDTKSNKSENWRAWTNRLGVSLVRSLDPPKPVLIISSAFGARHEEISRCPLAIKKYSESIGFVDRHNQSTRVVNLNCKVYKYWHAFFNYLMGAAIVNAHIMWKKVHRTDKPVSLRQFMRELYSDLFKAFNVDKRVLPQPTNALHYLTTMERRGHCVWCRSRTQRACCVCQKWLHDACAVPYHESLS